MYVVRYVLDTVRDLESNHGIARIGGNILGTTNNLKLYFIAQSMAVLNTDLCFVRNQLYFTPVKAHIKTRFCHLRQSDKKKKPSKLKYLSYYTKKQYNSFKTHQRHRNTLLRDRLYVCIWKLFLFTFVFLEN